MTLHVRRSTLPVVACLAVGFAGTGVASAVPAAAPGYTTQCPAPERLVSGTDWSRHRLAPGVVLQEGQHRDPKGVVRMHVLRVDVTNTHLALGPVMGKVAARHRLSALARQQRRLVAATNAGYFDYRTGAPLGPVVVKSSPVLAADTPTWAVGLSAAGRMQAGRMKLTGTVTADDVPQPLAGFNVAVPAQGITAYTPKWGDARVPLPSGAVSRYVAKGAIASGTGQFTAPPKTGALLVARGSSAVSWLRSLQRNVPVQVRPKVASTAPAAFRLAYAVGAPIVAPGGKALLGLSCRKSYPQPARTGIGFSADGRQMILVVVDDHLGTSVHGLDSVQLARVMADLGADQAYLLDGGGSTEMLAKLPSHGWSMRNHPADGVERPVPVGVGIYRR
jgi:hypothetical protein